MIYASNISCGIGVYHRSMPAQSIEMAIGRKATKAINRGDLRPNPEAEPFSESSCLFEIVAIGDQDPQAAIIQCLDVIEQSADASELLRGRIWVYLQLFDAEFLQVILNSELISRMNSIGVGLAIENRSF